MDHIDTIGTLLDEKCKSSLGTAPHPIRVSEISTTHFVPTVAR